MMDGIIIFIGCTIASILRDPIRILIRALHLAMRNSSAIEIAQLLAQITHSQFSLIYNLVEWI